MKRTNMTDTEQDFHFKEINQVFH